ncbi:MAG TPA: ThiF family adenylyltransferase [Actinomycetota bacterium]|nr:ThiF family adenylyltransferase [Actinomycetota bacterium]
MSRETSVAMTGATHRALRQLLLRGDGQEDLCFATYRASTGRARRTALLVQPIPPRPGDRDVHGNATVTGDYVLRAANEARQMGGGVALLHSHPAGSGWQPMSGPDRDAERSYANLAREITGLPLIGLTLAGRDQAWSARHWDRGVGREVERTDCVNVRVVDDRLRVFWHDGLRPEPRDTGRQLRTVAAWGHGTQADLTRRRVLVVGVGSVGLDVAVRLAASGLTDVTIMDFDLVEEHNLDRLIGAGPRDVRLRLPKTHVARREALRNATAADPRVRISDRSVCERDGLAVALDHDLIFSCVDRPWARAVLNSLAYTDLIPVIDGGIAIDTREEGSMRNATWRSHVVRPGRPCMVCTRQLDMSLVALDTQGLLDDPAYIAGGGRASGLRQNVAPLSVNVAAALLAQYVSFSVAPGGFGDPGPLQYVLSTHELHHLGPSSSPSCMYEPSEPVGDQRADLTGKDPVAERGRHRARTSPLILRLRRSISGRLDERHWRTAF